MGKAGEASDITMGSSHRDQTTKESRSNQPAWCMFDAAAAAAADSGETVKSLHFVGHFLLEAHAVIDER